MFSKACNYCKPLSIPNVLYFFRGVNTRLTIICLENCKNIPFNCFKFLYNRFKLYYTQKRLIFVLKHKKHDFFPPFPEDLLITFSYYPGSTYSYSCTSIHVPHRGLKSQLYLSIFTYDLLCLKHVSSMSFIPFYDPWKGPHV